MKIGFIGVGVMGKHMVEHLIQSGHTVFIYARNKSKVEPILAQGAIWCDSIEGCSKNKDAIITIVGSPKDVEDVYFAAKGVLASGDKGTYLIDMTTTSPNLSCRIYKEATARGMYAIDAPVSGGEMGATAATLSIMVGGDEECVNACLPILSCLGKSITYMGGAGSGQHTKMANQIAVVGALTGVCESITYAKKAGLDPAKMVQCIAKGAAGSWQMDNMGTRIVGDDLSPTFTIRHFMKDLTIVLEEAQERELALPVTALVAQMFAQLAKEGMEELGTQALIAYYK